MSKHVILGDVHLGKGINIGKPGTAFELNSRIQDQINLLNWTKDIAVKNGATSIIVTGDVYEQPRPHPALIQIFMTWLKQCEKVGLDVHVIAGNHDIIRTGSFTVSALDIVPAVELPCAKTYKNVAVVNYPGVSFVLLPFRDRRMYDVPLSAEALQKVKEELEPVKSHIQPNTYKVLIGHLTLEGSLAIGDEIDDMMNEIFCPTDMFADFDYVWMGHIHKPQTICTSPYVAHVGSMDRSDFHKSETDHDKMVILFDAASDSHPPFTEIIIPTRPLHLIEISVPEDKDSTDFAINYLHSYNSKRLLKDAIVKVEIELQGQDVAPVNRDKLSSFIYNKLNVHYLTKLIESRNVSVIPLKTQSVFDNNMSVTTATNVYLDTLSLSKGDLAAAREVALECIAEYQEKHESAQA